MYVDPIAQWLGDSLETLTVPAIFLRVLCSVCLSAIVGCERASKRHSAGLRTFMLVSLASTVAILLDICFHNGVGLLSAAAMISVAIVSVNSLLFSSRNQIRGLTTAFGLWACGIIGLATGAGYYTVTLAAFWALLCSLSLFPTLETYLKNRSNQFEVHLELTSSQHLQDFVTTIRRLGLKIDNIELNPAYANSGLSVYSIAISITSKELKQYKTHTEIIEALRTLSYIYHIEEMHL